MTMLDAQKQELPDLGLKTTKARRGVLKILSEEKRPLDASEILSLLHNKHIEVNQATVYRILDVFHDKGVIKRFEFQEGKFRFELHGPDHHHLVCEVCGAVEDVSDCAISELEKDIARKKKFLINRHALEFFGVCRQCQL